MRPKTIYVALCVVGAVLPYTPFLPWVAEHGLDAPLLFRELFANRISAAFAIDVIVSSAVFWVFVFVEGRRLGMRGLAWPIVGNVVIGLSFGLPLFLYMRERRLEKGAVAAA